MPTLKNLLTSLNQLDDPRRTTCGNFKYSLASMIACIFCATMAGCFGCRAIADYIADKFFILNIVIGLPNGVPSHDTINRILENTDTQLLAKIFREWAGIDKIDPEYLQVDGKTIRASKNNGEKASHIVTVYATDYKASLLERGVYDKENEISAFENMLIAQQINFAGKTVTGDAMFCQTSFCRAITESGGNWVFVLKKNQKTLYEDVKLYWSGMEATETKVKDISGHGRKGTITIRFTTDVNWILKDHDFTGLNCIAEVVTKVTVKGVTTTSTQYLIGSVKTLEELFIPRAKHWGIESMHWILDMDFEEDRCRSRKGNAPMNLNIFRKISLFFFNIAQKSEQFKNHSIKRLIGRCKSKFANLQAILALA